MLALDHNQIHPNPQQPRRCFDEPALDELAASIRQRGLLQPLVVRPFAGAYQLVAGERRWRACQRAGLSTAIPCNVVDGLDDEAAFILSVTENVARQDMTIIEEANAYRHLVNLGRTPEQVAELFGKTTDTIRYRLNLLDLRDDLQHLAARGQISRNVAWYLSRISPTGQAEAIVKVLAGTFRSDDEACRYLAAVRAREAQSGMFAPADDGLAAIAATKRRGAIEAAWARIESIGPALRVILESSGEEIATALETDTRVYAERVELLKKHVARAAALLSQAVAVREAQS